MEKEISAKRKLVLALVIVTILIFIGLVWFASAFFPWSASATPSLTQPVSAMQADRNCTYPIEYWTQHPEMVPGRIVVGDREYQAQEIQALLSKGDVDPVAKLQAQLVVAYLNIQLGAAGELIETTIFQAYGWVVDHPQGTVVAESELAVGERLFNLLEAFNLGLAGVAACPDAVVATQASSSTFTGTPRASFTPTKTTTPTRTRTPTARASATSTVRPATPVRRTSSPTATREPTNEPVNTPVPTTQAAPATPTRTPFVPTETHTAAAPTLTPPQPPPPTLTPPSP